MSATRSIGGLFAAIVLGVTGLSVSASVVINPIDPGDGINHGDAYGWDNAVANPSAPPDYLPGDGNGDGLWANWGNARANLIHAGQRNDDVNNWRRTERAFVRFDLPDLAPGETLVSATLRLYLHARTITSGNAGVYQSQTDNARPSASVSTYQDPSYGYIGDIATPATSAGQYVTLDVTTGVLSDYANDGATKVAAFRVAVNGLVYDDSVGTVNYAFRTSHDQWSTTTWPELVLETAAIPEPAGLAGVLAAGLLIVRRR